MLINTRIDQLWRVSDGLLNDLAEDYLHPNKFLKGDSTSQVFHFVKDVLIIFTDGYIEFGQYGLVKTVSQGKKLRNPK